MKTGPLPQRLLTPGNEPGTRCFFMRNTRNSLTWDAVLAAHAESLAQHSTCFIELFDVMPVNPQEPVAMLLDLLVAQ